MQRSEQNARQEAEDTVSSVKREYAKKEQELAQTQAEANRARTDAEATRKHQNELVRDKAMEMYQSKEKSLISAYKGKEMALDGVFHGSLLYGVLCTVFTAIRSEAFVSDFKTFFTKIVDFLTWLWNIVSVVAEWASQLGDMIPQETVAFLVHWLLVILVFVLCFGVLGILFLAGIVQFVGWYVDTMKFADNITLIELLVSLAISIFFADELRAVLPVNLLLLNILVHIVYVLVRWYVKGCMRSRGYY